MWTLNFEIDFLKTAKRRHGSLVLWPVHISVYSGFAASACGGWRTFGRRGAPYRAAGLRPDCQRFYILAASPRRAAGLRPDCQRFYILAASPRSAAGLRPDFHRFYILATSPHHAAGLKTSEIKFLGGGFRCSSKMYTLKKYILASHVKAASPGRAGSITAD